MCNFISLGESQASSYECVTSFVLKHFGMTWFLSLPLYPQVCYLWQQWRSIASSQCAHSRCYLDMTHVSTLQFSFASISSCRVPLGLKIHWFTHGQEDLWSCLGCGLFSPRSKGLKEWREKILLGTKISTQVVLDSSLRVTISCVKPSQMDACCLILVIYLS